MSRISKGYLPERRKTPAGTSPVPSELLRRRNLLAGVSSGHGEDALDLVSRTRRDHIFSSFGQSDDMKTMKKKSPVGSAKSEFFSVEIGKQDYDWLLTPPGTPAFSSNLKSASIPRTSMLSIIQPKNSNNAQRLMDRTISPAISAFSTAIHGNRPAASRHSARSSPISRANSMNADLNSRTISPESSVSIRAGFPAGRRIAGNQPVKTGKAILGGEIAGRGRTMSKGRKNECIRKAGSSGRGASPFPHGPHMAIGVSPVPTVRRAPRAGSPASAVSNAIVDVCRIRPKHNKHGSSETPDTKSSGEKSVPEQPRLDAEVIYGSSRYDAMLLKEDERSLNWLHSLDEWPDETNSLLILKFGPLPEPFSM